MYLHLGQNEIVPDHRIIGIFDLDKCSYEKRTREYLTRAEKDGVVLDVSGDLPKSFVVCDHPYHPQIVYLSQLNTSTPEKPGGERKAGTVRQMGRAGNGLPLNRSKNFFGARRTEPEMAPA